MVRKIDILLDNHTGILCAFLIACKIEEHHLNVPAVDTYRPKPKVCTASIIFVLHALRSYNR